MIVVDRLCSTLAYTLMPIVHLFLLALASPASCHFANLKNRSLTWRRIRKLATSKPNMIGRGQDYLSTQVRRVAAANSEYPESNVPLVGLTLAIMLIMMGVPELDSRPKGCSFDSQRLQRWFSTRHWKLQQRLSVQSTSYETRSNCSVRRENIYSFRNFVDKGEGEHRVPDKTLSTLLHSVPNDRSKSEIWRTLEKRHYTTREMNFFFFFLLNKSLGCNLARVARIIKTV